MTFNKKEYLDIATKVFCALLQDSRVDSYQKFTNAAENAVKATKILVSSFEKEFEEEIHKEKYNHGI